MMSSLPTTAYRVIDSTELEDLVVWTTQSCSKAYLNNAEFRSELRRVVGQATTTKYFAGPLDHQVEFDPAVVVPTSLPIVIHIQLGPDAASKAFLYLTDATTELHLPEKYIVTKDLGEDERRFELIRGLADGLTALTGLNWELAEVGGITTTIDDYDGFWTKYREDVFERIDYDERLH